MTDMSLRIETFTGGPVATNAYLVVDEATGDALVIDAPQGVTEGIARMAKDRGWTIRNVFITHTHWDHVADALAMQETFGVPVIAHREAVDRLEHPKALLGPIPIPVPPMTPDRLVDEGDTVTLGDRTFRVLHLPGHEPWHIALWSEPDGLLLSGDVLFPNGHGRTDLPGSDQRVMNATLRRLLDFPAGTAVYPGHGEPTTIGDEAPWIRQLP
jgi:glyoxylase-like metal-dependent hydrolase (beta-lactamase superfamily II)